MNKLILINDLPGAGKSTISSLLHNKLNNSFFIESDALIRVNPWHFDDKLSALLIKNASSLISNAFELGYASCILSGGVTSQESLDSLNSQIHHDMSMHYYWISAEKDIRRKRKRQRYRDEADNAKYFEFVDSLISDPEQLAIPSGDFTRFDTTNQQPDKIVEAILCNFA